jgi:hypothetical protein
MIDRDYARPLDVCWAKVKRSWAAGDSNPEPMD